jgi:GGDEF domain-containing protein
VLSVSASVGAASRCDHGHDAEGTLAAADAALLRAKSAGGRSWLLARSRDLAPRLAPAAQRRVRAAA